MEYVQTIRASPTKSLDYKHSLKYKKNYHHSQKMALEHRRASQTDQNVTSKRFDSSLKMRGV